MKVTWPLSAREVIVHYLEIEYFEGDLVIGLLNSVSTLKLHVSKQTYSMVSTLFCCKLSPYIS